MRHSWYAATPAPDRETGVPGSRFSLLTPGGLGGQAPGTGQPMQPTPRISICLPTLNCAAFLRRRMQSILAQTERDWELIVCDSHSTDGGWELLQTFAEDPRVRLFQVPREGVYAGWNECLRRARGRFIHVATADDFELPGFCERLLEALERHPEAAIAYSQFQTVGPEGEPVPGDAVHHFDLFDGDHFLGVDRPSRSRELFSSLAIRPPWVTISSAVFRRELLERCGFFPTDLYSAGDVGWAVSVFMGNESVAVGEPLACWTVRPGQASAASPKFRTLHSIWKSLRDRLHRESDGIPPRWRQVPGWDEALLEVRRGLVHERSGMFRTNVRKNPGEFFRALFVLSRSDPAFVLQQLSNGFAFVPARHAWSADRIVATVRATASTLGITR